MSNIVVSLVALLVALGYGTENDYDGLTTTCDVLKQAAVEMGIVGSADAVQGRSKAEVLQFIADNYGDEEKEPFDLSVTADEHCSIEVKKGRTVIAPGSDILYNGDKLKITITADEGYKAKSLKVNGVDFVSGETYTVDGHNVAIIGTSEAKAVVDLAVSISPDDSGTISVKKMVRKLHQELMR